ncbi:MAG: hemolysin family protein [Candidatus Latescibacteria bacterium]|nr:hemolysin family protein [Candidatus Latescibacterota bacterium]
MILIPVLVVLTLISVNALYVAAEFSAVSVRRSRIRQLADEGNLLARRLLPVLQDAAALDRYVAACQIGITLSSLILGAYSQKNLANFLTPLFADLGGMQTAAAQSTAAIVVLVGLTVLQVIFGELIPKSLALQDPSRTALATVVPMRWSLVLFAGFIAVLNGSGIAILKWLRVPYGGHRHIHSPEEISLLIAESRDGGLLEEDEHQRLREALQLTTRTARSLMIPRKLLSVVDIDTPLDEVLRLVGEGPYTRVPVYRGSPENIVGVIHAKDLLLRAFAPGGLASLAEVIQPAVMVPENVTVDRLLVTLRERRSHLAIVIDEHGGLEGLVTLDDILRELIGEVGDEFKAHQPEPEVLPDGRVRLPGLLPLEDLAPWTGAPWVRAPGNSAAITVGGMVAERLGHIPVVGERTTIHGVLIEVERMERHAVVSVLVTPAPSEPDEE